MILKPGLCTIMMTYDEFRTEYSKQNPGTNKSSVEWWNLYDNYRKNIGHLYTKPTDEELLRDMNIPRSEAHSNPDIWRETMFEASLKQRLVTYKEVVTHVPVNRSLEEIKQIFIEMSPTSLYVIPYSNKRPCIHITKQIMPSHGGVWMYYDSWADKTPKFYDWDNFYFELNRCGMENIKF